MTQLAKLFRDNDIISSDEEKAQVLLNTFSKSLTADKGLNGTISGNYYSDPMDI